MIKILLEVLQDMEVHLKLDRDFTTKELGFNELKYNVDIFSNEQRKS